MTQLQVIGGPKAGANIGQISVTGGVLSDSATFTALRLPAVATGLPRIVGNPNAGNDLTVETSGLSGITGYDWRSVGGASVGTGATLVRALTLATTLTQNNETSIVVNETIPASVPQTGTLDVVNNMGMVIRFTYDSYSGSTFTSSDNTADFNVTAADAGNAVRPLDLGQSYIECAVTHSGGVSVTPPFLVYQPMQMAMMASEDMRAVDLVPQHEATHIAIASGRWLDAATWLGGDVPKSGARAFIPHGISVIYDESDADVRLDWLRIDGALAVDHGASRNMLFDTMVITRGGLFNCGAPSARVPAGVTHRFTISNRVYRTEDRTCTDLDFDGFDPRLFGRGILNQGARVMWGAQKTPWLRTRSAFTLQNALTTNGATSVTLAQTPPPTTPAAGSLQVVDDSGAYRTIAYSGLSGRTFTITDTDFSTGTAAAGNAVFISFAPMAGDTVITLDRVPTGWAAGDEIVIGGTTAQADETEVRTVSAINGAVVTLDQALAHDHDNQNPAITRHDHQPGIGMLSHNIIIQSEDGADAPEYERGHTMDMHQYAKADIWGVEHRFLGRTFRNIKTDDSKPFGRFTSDTGIETVTDNTVTSGVTATARSNITGRYPVHFHRTGFGKAFVDTLQECSIRGAVGWGAAHHGCEARMNRSVVYDYRGGGIVSESGNETGEWFENLVVHSQNRIAFGVKNDNTISGDIWSNGTAFGMRSRALRVTGNMAMACSIAYGFYHRGGGNSIIPGKDVRRLDLDIKDLQRWKINPDGIDLLGDFFDYPIIHVNNNEGVACLGELLGVTKDSPSQFHGYSINISGLKGWMLSTRGIQPEYIGQYVLRDNDICAASNVGTEGFVLGPNDHRISVIRNRIEGFKTGVLVSNTTTFPNYQEGSYNDTSDPRFIVGNNNYINCTTDEVYFRDATPTFDHARFIPGPLPAEVDMSLSGGFVIGARNSSGAVENIPVLQLTDALGTAPQSYFGDPNLGLPDNGTRNFLWMSLVGYHQITQGDSINGETPATGNYAIIPTYYSDRLYGTPNKKYVAIELAGVAGGWTNLGEFELSEDPPVVAAADLNIPANSRDSLLDINALVTNTQGVTCTVSDSYQAPNHGRWTITDGVISYTPDPDWTGTDIAYVWVEGGGHAVRVDVNITVT